MRTDNKKNKKINNAKSWYFVLVVALFYIITAMISPDVAIKAGEFFYGLIIKLIPIFGFVFAIMVLSDLFLTPKKITKYIGKEAGTKKWVFIIVGGIISSGPIYMWYPLLKDLQMKGVKNGLLAAFLYNRAIKLPLIPLLLTYFPLSFVLWMSLLMVAASILQGIFINAFSHSEKN